MLKTNQDKLVMTAVQGNIIFPGGPSWRVTHDGRSVCMPGTGGLTYNVKVGDSVYGFVGDHIEPGVSSTASPDKREQGVNLSYNFYSCVGNTAKLISGEAKGSTGTVIGTHGGCEHVMIDFPHEVLEQMTHEDKIQVRSHGVGLKLDDYPRVLIHSLDPGLLHKLNIKEENNVLKFPVTGKVPAELMGSGLGRNDSFKADFDIMTSDWEYIEELGLDKLRFGDFVAIMDYKSFHGWSFKRGAVTIGIVVHSDSYSPGHGPGVTTLITSLHGEIEPVLDPNANIGQYLGIGRFAKS